MNPRRVFVTTITAVLALLPWAVQAATYYVTRVDDPVPNGCQANDCSLREAVIAANAAASADEVTLPPADYGLTLVGAGGAESGDLDVTGSLTIRGTGAVASTIQASNLMRILDVQTNATMHLENLNLLNGEPGTGEGGDGGCLKASEATVTVMLTEFDGCVGGYGGAISASNTNLTLTHSSIANGVAGLGGAAHVSGTGSAGPYTFVAHDVVLADNEASLDGGALYLTGAALRSELVDVLISGNVADTADTIGVGGGIKVGSGGGGGGQLVLDRVTLANNHANQGGGLDVADAAVEARRTRLIDNVADDQGGGAKIHASFSNGSLLFEQSTAYGNTATGVGGAFRLGYGQLVVRNSTIGDNTASQGSSALYAGPGADASFLHATLVDTDLDTVRIGGPDTSVSWSNSIIRGGCNISNGGAQYVSLGGNLEAGGDTCNLDQASDLVNLTPSQLGLGPLDYHGGATENYSLETGSEALDHALPDNCLHVDQRLAVREPAHCDTGSHEAEGVANDHLFADDFDDI